MSKPADDDTSWGDEIREALDILDKALVSHYFGEDAANHDGLDFAYLGGTYRNGESILTIAGGTITLADDDTSYIFVDVSEGTIATNTTGVVAGDIPLFEVVTASGAISSVTDNRTLLVADAVAVDHNHDSAYYTETELSSVADGSAGADIIGMTPIAETGAAASIQGVIEALVAALVATTNSSSGADLIGMTAIAETGEAATVQAIVEALIARLKAVTDGSSGADLIGATAIASLGEAATVQAILEALAVMTTRGDIAYQGASAPARLALGTARKILRVNAAATDPEWVQSTRGITFTIAGDLAAGQKARIPVPVGLTITGGTLWVGTAPTGADLVADLHKITEADETGTTVYATQANRPTIAAGNKRGTITVPDTATISKGECYELIIDQVGSTIAGADFGICFDAEVT